MNIRLNSIAVLCLAIGTAMAQPSNPPSEAERIDRLTILLDLNEGQKVEVARVLSEQRSQTRVQREEMKNVERPTREQMQAQRDQLRQQTIDKLRPILTDQQLKKFEVLNEGPMVKRHMRRKG